MKCPHAEVTNISKHSLWVLVGDEKMFLPFTHFPWFKSVLLEAVLHVERPSLDHLYWPILDVDLTLESMRHPEKFPLVAKG
jgi:hypothetical protein